MTDFQLFIGLSSALTGIAQANLAPDVDPTADVKQAYFDQAAKDPAFKQLLQIYDQNQSKPPAQVADIILNQSGDDIRYLGRAIMLEWYLGNWYEPAVLRQEQPFPPFKVISPTAYTQGWSWSVAQAHPMGYSELHFGYWSSDPPPLGDFTGSGS
jgi:hypothetical protein